MRAGRALLGDEAYARVSQSKNTKPAAIADTMTKCIDPSSLRMIVDTYLRWEPARCLEVQGDRVSGNLFQSFERRDDEVLEFRLCSKCEAEPISA